MKRVPGLAVLALALVAGIAALACFVAVGTNVLNIGDPASGSDNDAYQNWGVILTFIVGTVAALAAAAATVYIADQTRHLATEANRISDAAEKRSRYEYVQDLAGVSVDQFTELALALRQSCAATIMLDRLICRSMEDHDRKRAEVAALAREPAPEPIAIEEFVNVSEFEKSVIGACGYLGKSLDRVSAAFRELYSNPAARRALINRRVELLNTESSFLGQYGRAVAEIQRTPVDEMDTLEMIEFIDSWTAELTHAWNNDSLERVRAAVLLSRDTSWHKDDQRGREALVIVLLGALIWIDSSSLAKDQQIRVPGVPLILGLVELLPKEAGIREALGVALVTFAEEVKQAVIVFDYREMIGRSLLLASEVAQDQSIWNRKV